MTNNRRIFIISLFFLIVLLIIPFTFAESADNQTIVSDNLNDGILTQHKDIYFNSSLQNDNGDGSFENPYKILNQSRIEDYSTIHLADGEYVLTSRIELNELNVIGQSSDKTIITYRGLAFDMNNALVLTNITLNNGSILNHGEIKATNTIFRNSQGVEYLDGNSYGGAIYTDGYNPNAKVTIANCTFENNHALYGGAIFMRAGSLEITDSKFINNYAHNFGAALCCENAGNIIISKSKFIKNYCIDDAGTIYIKSSKYFNAHNLTIANSSATFGAAITLLNTKSAIDYLNAYDNIAKYDGGAIYAMYQEFTLSNSNFINNTARNGGALFIDDTILNLTENLFKNNNASLSGGAIYSIFNNCTCDIEANTFENNHASFNPDIYESDEFNLIFDDRDYTLFKITDENENPDIPSYYNMVDYDYLTPVKDQRNAGNCWSFAALAVLESCIKKITGQEYDFSEENMKNLMALYSDYGLNVETNEGGYLFMAWGYFSSWLGPVNDADDKYSEYSVLSSVLNSIVHVQNMLFFTRNDALDNDAIKKAILKYGAVATGMYYDEIYLYNNESYYNHYNYASNHGVSIVGWNDTYSKDNFRNSPEGDGAWIVRNSWGEDWGNNGYFYVSYYDRKLAEPGFANSAYTFVLNDTLKFNKNYQYEIGGVNNHLTYDKTKVYYKNIFNATGSEMLGGISTYFETLTSWTVSVYVNEVFKTTKSGISDAGYWTIILDDYIHLEKGDIFEVIFNITTDTIAGAPVFEFESSNKFNLKPNVSFISYDGSNWEDLSNHNSAACIKAFTISDNINTTLYLDVMYDRYNPVNITVTVLDEAGKFVDGDVKFMLNDEEIIMPLINGKVSFSHNFEKGINSINCSFEKEGFVTSSNYTTVEILKKDVELTLNVNSVLNNLSLNITANEKINETVNIFVNDDNYTVNLKNGSIIYNLSDLQNDVYFITVHLASPIWQAENKTYTATINVKSTKIIANDLITNDESQSEFIITLLDEDDNPLANRNISYTLTGSDTLITNENGQAIIPISLTNGKYSIFVQFDGDNDYFASNISKNITVKTNVEAEILIDKSLYDVNMTVKFSKPVSENITLTINNQTYYYTINNGLKVISLNNLENGQYNISVDLLNDKYNFTKTDETFIINVVKTVIVAGNLTTTELSNQNYTLTLLDENGNPISQKQIEYSLNNHIGTVKTDENGIAQIPINLNPGQYNITLKYTNSSDIYDDSVAIASIKVKTIVSGKITIERVLNNVSLTVTLSKDINDTASILINQDLKPITIKNGQASLKLNNLPNDYYTVKLLLNDNDYEYDEISTGFKLDTRHLKIMLDAISLYYHCEDVLTLKILDENNLAIKNKTLYMDLNGKSYSTTDDDGIVIFNIPKLDIGSYSLTVGFEGDNDIYPYQTSTNIQVLSSIQLPQDKYTMNSAYIVTFYADNGVLADREVDILLNGVNHNLKTDLNGQIKLNIDLNVGVYSVNVQNPETGEVKSQNIQILPRITQNTNIVMYYGAGKSYSIKVFNDYGQVAGAGELVKITVGGKTFNVYTNNAGYASLKLTQNAGSYKVTATYKGFTVSNKITVKPTLITKDIKVKKGKKIKYQATLLNINGKALKGKKITFKIKGKTYKAKTNKKGIAKITIKKKFKVGKYKITVKYGKLSSTRKITIKK